MLAGLNVSHSRVSRLQMRCLGGEIIGSGNEIPGTCQPSELPNSDFGDLPRSLPSLEELSRNLETSLNAQKLARKIEETIVAFGFTKQSFHSTLHGTYTPGQACSQEDMQMQSELGIQERPQAAGGSHMQEMAHAAIVQWTIAFYETLAGHTFCRESANANGIFGSHVGELRSMRNACAHSYNVSHPAVYDETVYDAKKHWDVVSKTRQWMHVFADSCCYYVDMLPEAIEREDWHSQWRIEREVRLEKEAKEREDALWSTENWANHEDTAEKWGSSSCKTTSESGGCDVWDYDDRSEVATTSESGECGWSHDTVVGVHSN